MTGLVYVEAQAPWGPVRIGAAASSGALLRQVTTRPEHIEDVGALDPERVADAARVLLVPAGQDGWIGTRPETARKAVLDARDRISATPVAADLVEASHAPPLATGEAMPMVGDVVEARRGQKLGGEGEFREFRESLKRGSAGRILRVSRCPKKGSEAAVSAVAMDDAARARLADLDVRAIRAGLGMTQGAFASTFGLPVSTLQDWEQGRSAPDQAARVLLAVIGYRPDAVRGALAGYG